MLSQTALLLALTATVGADPWFDRTKIAFSAIRNSPTPLNAFASKSCGPKDTCKNPSCTFSTGLREYVVPQECVWSYGNAPAMHELHNVAIKTVVQITAKECVTITNDAQLHANDPTLCMQAIILVVEYNGTKNKSRFRSEQNVDVVAIGTQI
jgi:hypothetical protein